MVNMNDPHMSDEKATNLGRAVKVVAGAPHGHDWDDDRTIVAALHDQRLIVTDEIEELIRAARRWWVWREDALNADREDYGDVARALAEAVERMGEPCLFCFDDVSEHSEAELASCESDRAIRERMMADRRAYERSGR